VPSVHHEVLDLLSNPSTRGKAFSVFDAVATESQNVKVASQIVPALMRILSQRAKDSPLEPNTEMLFASLCSFKAWAVEIACLMGEETKINWDESTGMNDPLAFLRGIHAKKRGARFEQETLLGYAWFHRPPTNHPTQPAFCRDFMHLALGHGEHISAQS
jgi:hypothetical protein